MPTQQTLNDLAITRQLVNLRLANGNAHIVIADIQKQAKEVEKALLQDTKLSEMTVAKLNKKIREINQILEPVIFDFTPIAELEYRYQMKSLGQDQSQPLPAILPTLLIAFPVFGATYDAWAQKATNDAMFSMERLIRQGAKMGLTNQEVVDSILGDINNPVTNLKGSEPIKKLVRDMVTITKTSTLAATSVVRDAFYKANADKIQALKQISILDTKTSDTCIARSGKVWAYPSFKPMGHPLSWIGYTPLHQGCRSIMQMILIGQVAANDSKFDDWLATQPTSKMDELLGKGRAALYRKGKMTLTDLTDSLGNPLTLNVLRERFS
jgi:hypothetical protein